jgi:hypothetical protein|tara:strand:- start:2902 stop:3534 length:633 start_codon:yes stop_codon:yes gene_type:complete
MITYKPFTVKDQKMLLLAKESGDKGQMIRAARDLITSCTLGKIDASKLTMYDFEYLFIKIRSKSIGETSDVLIKCKECQHSNEVSLNLEDCRVTETETDLKIKLTDEVGIVLKYPSFKDAERMSEEENTDELSTIVSCIDTIYTSDEIHSSDDYTTKELIEFIESLSSMQLKTIADALKDTPHAVLDSKFNCMKCGATNELTIEGLKNFF